MDLLSCTRLGSLGLLLALTACATLTPSASPTDTATSGPPNLSAQGFPAGTNILDQNALLGDLGAKTWLKDNIPFLEVPDTNIQQIYYYRWSVLQRNLKFTRPETGYIFTEFLTPVSYAGIYGGIAANIWHNHLDGRWLRNRQYLDDDMNHWARGLGQERQYQYTNDLASVAYERYLVTGDKAFTTGLLGPLTQHFEGWSQERREGADIIKTGFDTGAGMYYANPDTEATEHSIASLQTRDGYKWGWGYRPSINSFMYGDLRGLAGISRLAGDEARATEYDRRADTLKATVQAKLWDSERQFFFQMMRDNALQEYGQHPDGNGRRTDLPIIPEGTLLDGRELMGYTPWMFNLPDDTAEFSQAWLQILEPQGFNTPTGPSTAERRHRLFSVGNGCCWWNGPHWPFATSQALMGMGNLLHNYTTNTAVTKEDYYTVLKKYTDLQYKNGKPYVAEAASSLGGSWIYDSKNHSEHYNHSTYVDLIISGLLGVRPRADNAVDIDPLIPENWDYFALENVPYHGHNLTVLWDKSGNKYGRGAGLQVFVDGEKAASQAGLGKLSVPVGAPQIESYTRYVNVAANPFGDFDRPLNAYPRASASYTSSFDNAARVLDGVAWYDAADDGPNSRWTNYGSPNETDWLEVDFGAPTPLNQLKLAFYDDTGTGSIRVPAAYQVQYLEGGTWTDIPAQQRSPATPVANDMATINFSTLTTDRVRAVLTSQPGFAVGVTEFEASSAGNGSGQDTGQDGGQNAELPVGQLLSLQVTTPGYTDRFLRHQEGLGFTEVVSEGSSDQLKRDATFRVVAALDGSDCVSLELSNFPGQFVRHSSSRIRTQVFDNTDGFRQDATWCPRPGLSGVGVSLESRNFPSRYLRHFAAELWLAQQGGPLPTDFAPSFAQDVSWNPVSAWAP